ncbi:MAG: hypothetical protein AAFV33_18745 [Chloroflexota bacterium]
MLSIIQTHRGHIVAIVMMTILFTLVTGVGAQSDTINIDTGVFISEINNWLPLAITIAAIGVGVSGAFALALFVGRLLVNAFNGRF